MRGHLGEFFRGLGLREFGFRFHEVLAHLGRVEFGEELAGFDLRAEIDVPLLHVAAHAREDRRLHERLEFAGERERRCGFCGRGRDERDGRHREVARLGTDTGAILQPRQQPGGEGERDDDERDETEASESARRNGVGR